MCLYKMNKCMYKSPRKLLRQPGFEKPGYLRNMAMQSTFDLLTSAIYFFPQGLGDFFPKKMVEESSKDKPKKPEFQVISQSGKTLAFGTVKAGRN